MIRALVVAALSMSGTVGTSVCPPSKWATPQGTAYCEGLTVKAEGKGAKPDRVQFLLSYPGIDRPETVDAAVYASGSGWYASYDLWEWSAPEGPVAVVGYAWRGCDPCEIEPPLSLTRKCE